MVYTQEGVIKDSRPWAKIFAAGAAAVTLSIAVYASAFAAVTSVVYDATPSPTPPNVVSLGFQATATSELGDRVTLSKSGEKLTRAEVTMSTWAKKSEYPNNPTYGSSTGWSHPITVNVYSVNSDGTKGALIDTQERTVEVPWRPEGDSTCPNTGYGEGFAWRASDGNCYNGLAFTAGVDFDTPEVLPNDVIVSVAYNTQSYGVEPLNNPGPYNSLNVGIPESQPVKTGSDHDVDSLYWNSTYNGRQGGLTLDQGWAPNGTVALKLFSTGEGKLTKDDCKNNGWKNITVNGKSFDNQGKCVSYAVANPNASFKRQ